MACIVIDETIKLIKTTDFPNSGGSGTIPKLVKKKNIHHIYIVIQMEAI